MKTKNIVLALMLGGVLMTTGCEGFLDEDPRSSLTTGAYYKNAAQAEENINSMYRMGAPVRYGSAPSAHIGPTASISSMLTGYLPIAMRDRS